MATQTPKKPKASPGVATPLPPGAHSIKARRARTMGAKPASDVGKVHLTQEGVAAIELSPPHPPRVETPEYAQTHKLLVMEKDTPCKVCGVRHSTLGDPTANKVGAKALETHHFPCERSLVDALDWRKVHNDFPAVYSQASLVMWVDSPQNMLVLCDIHHRGVETGIHHLATQDFAVMPYLLDGYQVVARQQDAAAAVAKDEQIEQAAGIEQAVDQQIAASVSAATQASPAPKPKRVRAPKVKVALA